MPYANTVDLAEFMDIDELNLPSDAKRMLTRAEMMLNILTDNALKLTANATLATEVTCNQVEYWIESGISFGITAVPDSLSAGNYSFSGGMKIISPLVWARLNQEGLINRRVKLI